ncbi:hypothetical protein QBC36DRAFT_300358 [Triangularia setosa]|uniref:Uncharacterized protein n=1 Tax=Triangularia setosa TaxID=2587417 RepID=A0AAN6W8Q9_9PEZI|nr:hypothetical protein QBC36DRAFT_300358 [Podospora setosa]
MALVVTALCTAILIPILIGMHILIVIVIFTLSLNFILVLILIFLIISSVALVSILPISYLTNNQIFILSPFKIRNNFVLVVVVIVRIVTLRGVFRGMIVDMLGCMYLLMDQCWKCTYLRLPSRKHLIHNERRINDRMVIGELPQSCRSVIKTGHDIKRL